LSDKKELKKCLWCLKDENEVSFNKDAHIIPQSLGANKLSKNECDDCNSFFGSRNNQKPAIDLVIKEAFNLTRHRILLAIGSTNQKFDIPKFRSRYFKVNAKNNNWSIRQSFKLRRGFQKKLCQQFKRGIFKIVLEDYHLKTNNGFHDRFNFMREFVRHDFGDYPVYYFLRKFGAFMTSPKSSRNPEVVCSKGWEKIMENHNFFEFEILGHRFGIPTSRLFDLTIDNYRRDSLSRNHRLFSNMIKLNYLTEIDLTLKIMDN
jgi:HNH endonuclease